MIQSYRVHKRQTLSLGLLSIMGIAIVMGNDPWGFRTLAVTEFFTMSGCDVLKLGGLISVQSPLVCTLKS